MLSRLPPKISLKHEWKRELGSGHAQRAEAGQLSRSFQSNQSTLNPIRERSGRLDITHDVIGVQDERQTSRSQEIDVASFCEEPSSSERTGRLVETNVRPTSLSEDSKSLNVEQTHDRTGRPVATLHAAEVQGDSQVCHEADTLNVDDADHDVSHESIMVNEADMDFRIPGQPHSVVKHAQSYQRSRIENHPNRLALQQDLRQNQSFNPFSPESKQMIQDVGNIELCELLETEPKAQSKVCLSYWDIGIVCCTCGHFLRKGRGANQKFIKYTMDLLPVPEYVIKKGRPHGHRYGKKPGDRVYFSANQLKKKFKKQFFQGIHDRFIRDETFRNRMIENGRTGDACRQMDDLANEDHTHHFDPQEITIIKVIGGFVRTRQAPILCQWSTDMISNKHCLPCSN